MTLYKLYNSSQKFLEEFLQFLPNFWEEFLPKNFGMSFWEENGERGNYDSYGMPVKKLQILWAHTKVDKYLLRSIFKVPEFS